MAYVPNMHGDYYNPDPSTQKSTDRPYSNGLSSKPYSNPHQPRIQEKMKKNPVFQSNGFTSNGQTGVNGGQIGGGLGEQRFDARFKVLMLGNSGVGKTSLLRSLMGGGFFQTTISTIGIDMVKKIFNVENNRIQLEVWDTAGQEQYFSIVSLHFRDAKAFIITYDVTDPTSFDQIRKYWLRSVDEHMEEAVPVFFAANKVDLKSHRQITKEQGESLASQQSAHGYFETSAKTGLNVENLFHRVAESMVSTWGAPKRWYEMAPDGGFQQSPWHNHMGDEGMVPNLNGYHEGTVRLQDPATNSNKIQCCGYKPKPR